MKDKKQQNATNNGTYFSCEIILLNQKLQLSSNQVQNFVSRKFNIK